MASTWGEGDSQPPAPEYRHLNRLPGLLWFLAYLVLLFGATALWRVLDGRGSTGAKAYGATVIVSASLSQFLLLQGASQLVLVVMEMREAVRRNERQIIELTERQGQEEEF